MNVIVFGASGGIGKCAVKHALAKGYHVSAYVRHPEKLTISHENLKIIQGEISDYLRMEQAVAGQDAVVWCVGISMKRKYDKMTVYEGYQNLVKAMKANKVTRLIGWATPSVPFSKDKKSFITIVPSIIAEIALTRAKKEMVAIGNLTQSSGLDWTLVRFMAPKDTPYTGKVKVGFGDVKMSFAISREDIAAFMVEQIESREYVNSMPIIGS